MAYCRFIGADAYIFMNVGGFLDCCGCILETHDTVGTSKFFSTQEMIEHIAKHREVGHEIPPYLEAELWEDDYENFGNKEL